MGCGLCGLATTSPCDLWNLDWALPRANASLGLRLGPQQSSLRFPDDWEWGIVQVGFHGQPTRPRGGLLPILCVAGHPLWWWLQDLGCNLEFFNFHGPFWFSGLFFLNVNIAGSYVMSFTSAWPRAFSCAQCWCLPETSRKTCTWPCIAGKFSFRHWWRTGSSSRGPSIYIVPMCKWVQVPCQGLLGT